MPAGHGEYKQLSIDWISVMSVDEILIKQILYMKNVATCCFKNVYRL